MITSPTQLPTMLASSIFSCFALWTPAIVLGATLDERKARTSTEIPNAELLIENALNALGGEVALKALQGVQYHSSR